MMTRADIEGRILDLCKYLFLTDVDLAAETLLLLANTGAQGPCGDSGEPDTPVNPDQTPREDSRSEASSAPPSTADCSSDSEISEQKSEKSDDPTQWNLIIPEPSRDVPVGNIVPRIPGRGRQAISTPATGRVSAPQRSWRLWAMRQLLGEPVGITDEELRLTLIATGWDLGAALRSMNDILNQARDRHRANASNRSPAEQQRDRLIGTDSLHHNRRLGIDFLYTRLVQVVRPDQRNMLTTLTLGQLLADHRFDVDEAVNAFLERLVSAEELERHQREERRLRMINPNQLHQDQRIARLMEIVGTDDYYAARGLLMTHGFDMLRAMDHWMRHGLAAQPIPPHEFNRRHFRSPHRPHTDTEDLWPNPRFIAGRLDDIDEDDLADADADYDDPSYPNRDGWFVHYPRMEGRVGVNIPTRLRNDYIRRGQFRVVQIRKVKRQDGSGIKDYFDYNESHHLEFLNTEASQWFRRTLGEKTKERGKLYQEDENGWIWWWHNERLWELIETHPELQNATTASDWQQAGLRWPMAIDTQRLQRDFNNHWVPQGHQSRDVRSLDAQRRRIPRLCEDFGYPYSPPHKKRGKSKKPGQSPPGSGDDDDPPKPPKKTPKSTPKDKGKKDKGKQKVSKVDDEEEPEGEEDDDGSPTKQPAKKSPASAKKGSASKRKRGVDDEDESDDYAGPSASASGGKRGGGPRRSDRNRRAK
jgi:hypothetical protein